MNKAELLKLLRKPKPLYGFVAWTEDDGHYHRLVKADFIKELQAFGEDDQFRVGESDFAIWIN